MSAPETTAPIADYAEPLQKALPDGVWTFRRVFVFGLTLLTLALVWRIVELAPAEQLPGVAKWLICLNMLLVVVYTIGPTAEHFVRLGAAARVLIEALVPWKRGAP